MATQIIAYVFCSVQAPASWRALPVRGFAAAAGQRIVWVKKEGGPRFVKVRSSAVDVDDLISDVADKLGMQGQLSNLTLHIEAADGSLGPALDSTATVDEALNDMLGRSTTPGFKLRIVVKVVMPAAPVQPIAELQEYPPNHLMSKLARGLLEADVLDVPVRADGTTGTRTITLPHDVSWPDMDSAVLFVRHFYEDLWGKVLNSCKPQDDLRDAVIMGTPGIAKSAFGLYALYRAVKAGRTVIYTARKGGEAMFKDGKAYQLPTKLVSMPEMNDREALYICDSLVPVARVAAFRLLITSPKKENWSTFVQSPNVRQFVLPSFTLPEMLQLSKVAFSGKPRCSDDEVSQRFKRWGGSARSVLTHSSDRANQERLQTAAGSLPLATVEAAMIGTTALDGVGGSDYVHRLFDILPFGALPNNTLTPDNPQYYDFHHAQLITDHVAGLFADALVLKDRAELYRSLHKAASDPAAATLRGKLYERCIVVPRFVHGPGNGQGSDMRLVRLTPTLKPVQPGWLQVPMLYFKHGLQLVHFHNPAELASKWNKVPADAIFVPYSKEFPVVDFVLRVGGEALLANATVGESHDVKLETLAFWDALLPAVGLADANKEIPLAWILDKPAFERFDDAGQVKSQSGGDLVAGVTARHPIGRRLAQYKLLVEVPPVIA